MFNNRMLAVAAVLVMAVPALGAATPIVVPPVPEQLVEGHTVFTVIEIVAVTQTNQVRFAAAVAVLVREYQNNERAQRFPGVLWFNDQYLVNPYQDLRADESFRYPCGGAVMAVNRGDPDPRVVILDANVQSTTLQADIPGPVDGVTGDVDQTLPGAAATYGRDTQTYTNPPWQKPYPGTYTYGNDYAWVGSDVGPTTINATNPSADTQVTAWSDTVVGATGGSLDNAGLLNLTPPWDYRESYLITDPNDHSWVIDKYNFYTRDQYSTAGGLDSQNLDNLATKLFDDPATQPDGYQPSEHYPEFFGGALRTEYAFPVWVVNMLGSPVFITDNGQGIENCVPFKDTIEALTAPLNGALCGVAVQDVEFLDGAPLNLHEGNDTDITLNAYNGVPPWTDDPCMSYQEPSRNGFCYGGQEDIGTGCPHGSPGNDQKHYKDGVPNEPLRQYNALLYFKLQDLRVRGLEKDHCTYDPSLLMPDGSSGGCNPALSSDTNGCSEEIYPWGPNPPQAAYDWPCPERPCAQDTNGVDDCEGNSHPFHPTAPPHEEQERCLPQFFYPATGSSGAGYDDSWLAAQAYANGNGDPPQLSANPTNHGGSHYVDYYNARADDAGWYSIYAPCDYTHATRNIDIYFSPAGRPFPPIVRYFDVVDLEGSSAPFNDFHSAYPGVP